MTERLIDEDSDVDECFEALQPACSQIANAVRQAPLNAEKKSVLATLIATNFMGMACAAFQDANPNITSRAETARAVNDLILSLIQRDEKQERH